MRIKGIGFSVAIIVLLASCSSLKISKLPLEKPIKKSYLKYQLPQQAIQVRFILTKKQAIPGPYKDFAKSFLEIEPSITTESIQWSLTVDTVKLVSLPDTSQQYILTGDVDKIKASNRQQLFQMQSIETFVPDGQSILSEATTENLFKEQTIKNILIEESETSYKTVVEDSTTKKIPVVNKVLRNKTIEERAKDASKTLTKTRKRYYRLIAGLNEKTPELETMKMMLNELKQKETQYLELFMGKTLESRFELVKTYLPTQGGTIDWFRFSSQKGLVETGGQVVQLLLSNPMLPSKADSSLMSSNLKGLPYRNSEQTQLSIEWNHNQLYRNSIVLPQWGSIRYIELKKLIKNDIIFDTPKGGIISY